MHEQRGSGGKGAPMFPQLHIYTEHIHMIEGLYSSRGMKALSGTAISSAENHNNNINNTISCR